MRAEWKRGQALAEFVAVLAMLTAAGAILALLLFTVREYGGRILHLLAADLP